ncbi:hypothetical protein [Dysgonomonas massiliensis]|uniref:hypothetical protein n=1 Tax=Dysgonomonas massiliensis TaxID=2040292 RepID=UPI000C76839B|nr:hypothetical protein [Dysgonomonas massiliensis]
MTKLIHLNEFVLQKYGFVKQRNEDRYLLEVGDIWFSFTPEGFFNEQEFRVTTFIKIGGDKHDNLSSTKEYFDIQYLHELKEIYLKKVGRELLPIY